jgi:hypothetical protein
MYGYPNTKSDNHKRRYINMKTVQQKAKKMHVDSVSLFLLLLLLSRVAIFGRRLFFSNPPARSYIHYVLLHAPAAGLASPRGSDNGP